MSLSLSISVCVFVCNYIYVCLLSTHSFNLPPQLPTPFNKKVAITTVNIDLQERLAAERDAIYRYGSSVSVEDLLTPDRRPSLGEIISTHFIRSFF